MYICLRYYVLDTLVTHSQLLQYFEWCVSTAADASIDISNLGMRTVVAG